MNSLPFSLPKYRRRAAADRGSSKARLTAIVEGDFNAAFTRTSIRQGNAGRGLRQGSLPAGSNKTFALLKTEITLRHG